MKYIIDRKQKFDGLIFASMTDDLHNDYGGETIEELRERYPSPTYDLGVIDDKSYDEMLMQYRKELASEPFKEITGDSYLNMLECVPPSRQGLNWFFVGEAYIFDFHTFCFTDGKRYWSALRSVRTPKADIEKEISMFLESQQ